MGCRLTKAWQHMVSGELPSYTLPVDQNSGSTRISRVVCLTVKFDFILINVQKILIKDKNETGYKI